MQQRLEPVAEDQYALSWRLGLDWTVETFCGIFGVWTWHRRPLL